LAWLREVALMRLFVVLAVVVGGLSLVFRGHPDARPSSRDDEPLTRLEAAAPIVVPPISPPGSRTKVFTAALIAQLAEAGALDLEDHVAELLPSYRQETDPRLTVCRLLDHTAGLPDAEADYALLGAIIEQITGKPYAEVVREMVLLPSVM
jgi:CubicO group peptidase (beta-lactamase class C family)